MTKTTVITWFANQVSISRDVKSMFQTHEADTLAALNAEGKNSLPMRVNDLPSGDQEVIVDWIDQEAAQNWIDYVKDLLVQLHGADAVYKSAIIKDIEPV